MEHEFLAQVIHTVENLLVNYGAYTAAISVFFLGENAAIAVFALSFLGFINPLTAFFFAFIGSILSDIFWFFIAEFVLRKHYEKQLREAKETSSNRFFMNLIDKHFFWMLIFIKFMVGVRLILTLYIVLKNKVPFWRKIFLNSVGTIFFLGVLFPVGWVLAQGNQETLSIEQTIERIITGIFLLFLFSHVCIMIVKKILEKRVTKIPNEKVEA